MTNKQIRQFSDNIDALLSMRRLADAYHELRNMAKSISAWAVSDRIDRAEQGYNYLLSYMIDGIADPGRDQVYAGLVNEVAAIRDMLVRDMSLPETPTLYFSTLRSVNSHGDESLQSLYDQYRHLCLDMSPFSALSSDLEASRSDRIKAEQLELYIFNRLWVTFPFNVDDAHIAACLVSDEALPATSRALFVSSLVLGLLDYYDERRFAVLIDAYSSEDPMVSVRALVGIALTLDKYKADYFDSAIVNRIAALRELTGWQTDIKQAFVELIRTNDTERISEKLRDEIFPEIKKMSKDIADRFSNMVADADNISAEANPEWEGLISDEKIRNNLKELSELQQEGADVFMATFAGLKQFPFFNEVANWFMPYRADHSIVASIGLGVDSPVTALIDNAPFVCDSDKYSMLLSLSMMPESQRTMMAAQLDSQRRDIEESMALADKSIRPVERKALINNYVLTIYRFYKLFRRKGEFYNPFAHVMNPVDISLIAGDFASEEALVSLGEFYFKVGLYGYAASIFSRLDDILDPDPLRYQKLGFCNEKLGNFEAAATYYEQADLLDGKNVWNLRRLASMCRRLGRYDQAISVTQRLDGLLADDIPTALNLGYLYILSGRYEDAISQFHKVEFLDDLSTKPLRPLAWALFLNRNFEQSAVYYKRIIDDSPTATDYLNMGHLAWAQNKLHDAIRYYSMSAEASSLDSLISSIRDDKSHLAVAGVDVSLMPLLVDAITYSIRKSN